MSFKEGSYKRLLADARLLRAQASGGWVAQDIDAVELSSAYGSFVGLAGDYGNRLIVADSGEISIGGSNSVGSINSDPVVTKTSFRKIPLSNRDEQIYFARKGYPCVIVCATVLTPIGTAGLNNEISAMKFKGWIGNSYSISFEETRVELFLGDGTRATLDSMIPVAQNDQITPPPMGLALPEFASPILPVLHGAYTTRNLSFAQGNRPIFDASGSMPFLPGSYVITNPGRTDASGRVQESTQGDLAVGNIELNVPVSEFQPVYDTSTNCEVSSSVYLPTFRDSTTGQIYDPGGHRLSITIADRDIIGLTNISPTLTQTNVKPLQIDGQSYFIDRIIEEQDNSLTMDLVSSRVML